MILQVAMFPGFIFMCVYILTYIKNNAYNIIESEAFEYFLSLDLWLSNKTA